MGDVELQNMESYQGDMIAGSASKTAAVAGDNAAAAAGAATTDGMQPIDFDLDHAMQRGEYFRKVAMSYGTRESDEKEYVIDKQASYARDASNLSQAGLHFNTLVPQAQFAMQSRARLDAIRSALPDYVNLEGGLAGHDKALDKGMGAAHLKADAGKVTTAAHNFSSSRVAVMNAATEMQALATGELVDALEQRLAATQAEKLAIETRISKVVGFIDVVGSIAGKVGTAGGKAKAVAPTPAPEGLEDGAQSAGSTAESAGGGVESGSNVASRIASFGLQMLNAQELDRLENEIQSLSTSKVIWSNEKNHLQAVAIHGRFAAAKADHLHKTTEYLQAIENRRKQYAIAGKAASVAEAGASGAKRNDPLAQYLLVASAYQEHAQIVGTTLDTAEYARGSVLTAWTHMNHRLGSYQLGDLSVRKDEGLGATDAVQIKSAWLATSELVTSLRDEQGFVDRESKRAQDAMGKGETNAAKGY